MAPIAQWLSDEQIDAVSAYFASVYLLISKDDGGTTARRIGTGRAEARSRARKAMAARNGTSTAARRAAPPWYWRDGIFVSLPFIVGNQCYDYLDWRDGAPRPGWYGSAEALHEEERSRKLLGAACFCTVMAD
jgi:hypothetical protein